MYIYIYVCMYVSMYIYIYMYVYIYISKSISQVKPRIYMYILKKKNLTGAPPDQDVAEVEDALLAGV